VPDTSAAVWARFYDIASSQPFFTGRDGVKHSSLKEIDHERRIGYAWYGTWPTSLLTKKYPEWKKKNNIS
jgi:PelA/Pel-15E family pectate lyase